MFKEYRKFGIAFISIFVAIFVISLSLIGVNKALAVEEEGDEEEITPEQFYDMDDPDEPNLEGSNSNSNPKPVWMIGHRANNRGDVDKALRQGANGVEIDIRRGDPSPDPSKDESKWIINHDHYWPNHSLTLEEYFAFQIHDTAKDNDASKPNKVKDGFCVLFLDIKTPNKDLPGLQSQVRGWMDKYKMQFYVVYQVETFDQAMMPGGLCQCWCNHWEGVCMAFDCGKRAKNVIKWDDWCKEHWQNGMAHSWYGNGIGWEPWWWIKGRINTGLRKGKVYRDSSDGATQKIGTWSLNSEKSIVNSFIKYDCDWALLEFGGGDVAPNGTRGLRNSQTVLKNYSNKIRLANLNDYPFENSWKAPRK